MVDFIVVKEALDWFYNIIFVPVLAWAGLVSKRIATVQKDLADFKTEVATNYVKETEVQRLEDRMNSRFDIHEVKMDKINDNINLLIHGLLKNPSNKD